MLSRLVRGALWPPERSIIRVLSAYLLWFVVAVIARAVLDEVDDVVASVVDLVVYLFIVIWMLFTAMRIATADAPAARPALALTLGFFVLAGVGPQLGVSIELDQADSFYSTLAQVDVALLIVAALQLPMGTISDKRRRWLAVLTAALLALSVIAALIVLGRGADSPDLFRVSVGGCALGLFTLLYAARERFLPREQPRGSVTLARPPERPNAPNRRLLAVVTLIGWLIAQAVAKRSRATRS